MPASWLLLFLPVAVALEHFVPERSLWIFLAAALAIPRALAGHAGLPRAATSPLGPA